MEIRNRAQGTPGGLFAEGPGGPRGTEYAQARLAEVAERLEQAKLEALLGIHYDPDEFDHLIVEYRRAKRFADSAHRLAVQLSSFAVCGPQPAHPALSGGSCSPDLGA